MKNIILYSVIGIIALGVIAGTAYILTPTVHTNYVATPVTRMNIVETVTGTGQVAADQQSILAFDQQGGTIATVNVAEGDQVYKGQVLGTLKSDILQANLEAAQAQLASLQQGAKPSDIALYSQKTTDAQTALSSTIHDAYLKAEDAVQNQVDVLFNNPGSANPVINIWTQSQMSAININNEYLIAEGDLATWKSDIDANASDSQTQTDANVALTYAKSFLADLGTITANLNSVNSGLTQTAINSDRSIVNGAASEVAGAISEYTGALSAYSDATASLTSQESGSGSNTIAVQQAVVDGIQAQINHTIITAPFDGIITDVEPKVGEVFAAGTPAFSIISEGVYKVEVYVSETDVAKLTVGNSAEVALDAYGSATLFPATVTAIDPAETVVGGVNSYKVTLHFTQNDPRIISGMTANVSITAGEASRVIAVPSSAIITEGSATYVLAENANGTFVKKQIETGITGIDASSTSDTNTYVEVESGLSGGDSIASFGSANSQ